MVETEYIASRIKRNPLPGVESNPKVGHGHILVEKMFNWCLLTRSMYDNLNITQWLSGVIAEI